MICEERSGFLFAHACDRPAVWQCVGCGKNICLEHTRLGAQGNTCIACLYATPEGREQREQSQAGDDPYFYGTAGYADSYYDADDYAAFDSPTDDDAAGGGEADFTGS